MPNGVIPFAGFPGNKGAFATGTPDPTVTESVTPNVQVPNAVNSNQPHDQ